MVLTGIGDEAGNKLDAQIKAARQLGWTCLELRTVEIPGFEKGNIHDIPDKAFDLAVERLRDTGLGVYCFSSTIANWSKKFSDPFEITLAEVRRCIPRMQRLNTKFVRIMSYKPDDEEYKIPREVFRRIGDVTKMFIDAGLQPVHENCMNYGGMSWQHAMELLEKCPGLKWLFDTGNPIFNLDRAKSRPWPRQDPWEFWLNIRDHVAHIHVKDAIFVSSKNKCEYTGPGEGQSKVREILRDALARGYDGAISIEPHVSVVFHDSTSKADDQAIYDSFVHYGEQLQDIISDTK